MESAERLVSDERAQRQCRGKQLAGAAITFSKARAHACHAARGALQR